MIDKSLVAGVLLWSAAAAADPNRFALIVGANEGERDEPRLRFAQGDAERLTRALASVGGFAPENVVTLLAPSATRVRGTLISLNARIRQLGGDSLLLVFYSGHADAEALHLYGTRLGMQELRELVAGSHSSARVLVLDACRSGTVTRVKGRRTGPSFAIDLSFPVGAEGLAILSSSAAGESAQESDALGASFFTHAFISALLGAGDANGDGAVTLSEAFAYARERTLSATASTFAGPQHPTFRLEIGGREDLVLTRPGTPGEGLGVLEFPEPGRYLVYRGGLGGPIVAEVYADARGRRLSLERGRYLVVRREREYLMRGELAVAPGAPASVRGAALRREDYARIVRKGGTDRRSSWALDAHAGVRGELLDLGTAWHVDAGARLDLRPLSLSLRLGWSAMRHDNERLTVQSRELGAAFAGVHVFDVGPVGLGLGLEVGVDWLHQGFSDGTLPPRDSAEFHFGALGVIEIPIVPRLDVHLEGAGLTYVIPVSDAPGQHSVTTSLTYRVLGGFSVHLQ